MGPRPKARPRLEACRGLAAPAVAAAATRFTETGPFALESKRGLFHTDGLQSSQVAACSNFRLRRAQAHLTGRLANRSAPPATAVSPGPCSLKRSQARRW